MNLLPFPKENIIDLKLNVDKRGFTTELLREDWFREPQKGFTFHIRQCLLSASYRGVVRAWHRHKRGQDDYMTVIEGASLVVYVGKDGNFYHHFLLANSMQVIKVPGHLWHGTKALGAKDTYTIYHMNQLYDYENPDEERLPYYGNPINPLIKNFPWEDFV